MINEYGATDPMVSDANPMSNETASNDDVISTLNGLIQICRDGQEGFKEAAEGVERSDIKSTFYEYSQQRAEFAGVLQGLVRSLGGDPETEGSFSGALHRGWIDIKSVVTGRDEHAILNECERGEDAAKKAYSDALEMSLPSDVADVLKQQSQAVMAAHNRVRDMRDSGKHQTASTGNVN